MREHRSRCGSWVAVVVALALVAPLAAQAPHPPPPQTRPTFRSGARLTVQTVTVKDEDGRPIEGLTAKDFALTEDGVPQTIGFVEFQRVEGAPDPAGPTPGPGAAAPRAAAGAAATPYRVPSLTPGGTRYRDRRLLVLYFDLSALMPLDAVRAFAAAEHFIEAGMEPQDLLAIMAFEDGAVRIKQDFTDRRDALREAMNTLMFGEDENGDGIADIGAGSATAFGQNDVEFNLFNSDRQLSALQTAVTMLQTLPERKALVYFASGLRLTGMDNQAQLRATTNAAIRAHVAISPVDARGLVAQPMLGDVTRPSRDSIAILSGQLAATRERRFQQSQDTLYSLAQDTGGKALLDHNDLSLGIVQAAQTQESYYILGYESTHTAADGRFRRVRIALTGGLTATLSYRPGYFADKAFAKFSAADKERQLEEALMLENPLTEITIAMEVNYFQLNRAEYYVPVAVKIPGSELALARRRGAARTSMDVIGEVKDDHGITVQNVRDHLDIELRDDTATQFATRPIHYETGFTLLPGTYVIKLLVRDAVTGRIGTYQATFVVPNLDRETVRLATSSVVLSSQRVPIGDELHSARGATLAAHPLVRSGQKLVPSVTRVFSRGRDLHVFLQAYPKRTSPGPPLMAYASFYTGGEKVFESGLVTVAVSAQERSTAVPVAFTVPLASLPPGRYECQVTTLEPGGVKVAFWRAPIVVVP